MQYDDLYRWIQFATNFTWGTDSQFVSHQPLHRPDSLTATTTCLVPPRKPSRLVINPATRKQVCYDFQRGEGCCFGSSCRCDHVLNPHSTAEISPNCTLTEDLTEDVSSTSLHAGSTPPFTTHHPAAYLSIEAGSLSESMQQPKVAKISTDLISKTWATELSHDPDMGFICVQYGFDLLPLKTKLKRNWLRVFNRTIL